MYVLSLEFYTFHLKCFKEFNWIKLKPHNGKRIWSFIKGLKYKILNLKILANRILTQQIFVTKIFKIKTGFSREIMNDIFEFIEKTSFLQINLQIWPENSNKMLHRNKEIWCKIFSNFIEFVDVKAKRNI